MTPRFWLCFESGERRGESLVIPDQGLVVGRAADCELRLTESSVSGKHARLKVEAEGVRVTDLESRNGTWVNGERVTGRLLAHGDSLGFGTVKLRLTDKRLAGAGSAAPSPLNSDVDGTAESERLTHVDVGRLGIGRGLSPVVWIALVLALGGGGWASWRLLQESSPVPARLGTVEVVAGELLKDGSFEDKSSLQAWDLPEDGVFEIESSHRNRGALGLGADLAGGEQWRIASPWCRVREGRSVTAVAYLRSTENLTVTGGLEFGRSGDDGATLRIRGALVSPSSVHVEHRITETVLPGFDSARWTISIVASEAGLFEMDDVSVTESDPKAEQSLKFEEFELFRHSVGSTSLVRIDTIAASGLRFELGSDTRAMTCEPTATGWLLRAPDEHPEQRFRFVLADSLGALGFATLHNQLDSTESDRVKGTSGLQRRHGEFTAESVSGLLAGAGTFLVRFGFESPVQIDAKRGPQGMLVTTGPVTGTVELQLSFREQRNLAANLADAARRAERADQPGESLARWAQMLRDVPFDAGLVAEAGEARGRMLSTGLDEVERARVELVRARFFDLPDIYRRTARVVNELRERYSGSEVDEAALRLSGEIELALAEHVDEQQAAQRVKLSSVAEILDRTGADKLANHVRDEAGVHPSNGEGDH